MNGMGEEEGEEEEEKRGLGRRGWEKRRKVDWDERKGRMGRGRDQKRREWGRREDRSEEEKSIV